MKDKKTEKDLSILDNQDVEIEETAVKADDAEGVNPEKIQKKKVKPWIIYTTIIAIVVVLALGVFAFFEFTTLATYDGGRVTTAELNKYVRTTLLAQGVTAEEITEMDQLRDNLLISLANEEVFFTQLENLGIAQLTDEEIDALKVESRTLIDEYLEANIETIAVDLPEGYTDKDLERAKKEAETEVLNGIGCEDFNDFVDLRIKEATISAAYTELIPLDSITPTDEEVKAEYELLLADQILAYSDNPAAYITDYGYIEMPLYTPSGIRLVRHVLITISEEAQNEIYALEMEGKTEEADAAHTAALAEIQPQMDEILALLDSGEITFTEAIDKYNEDEGMIYNPDGYEVCEGFDMYVPEFTEAALALTEINEYSGLVATAYGYHIVEYHFDYPTETVPFEDVSEYLAASMVEVNRSEAWYSFLETWPVELNLEFKDGALNELDIY